MTFGTQTWLKEHFYIGSSTRMQRNFWDFPCLEVSLVNHPCWGTPICENPICANCVTAATVHSSVDPFNPMWVCPIPQSRNSSPKFIGRRYSTSGEAMYWLHAQPRPWISSFYCKFASMKICSPNLALVARFATVGHSSRQPGLKFLRSCMRSHLYRGFVGMVWWFSGNWIWMKYIWRLNDFKF